MATLRLTKRNVDGLNPGSKAYVTYDSEVTGFGVRVMPSGLKSWIIEYRRGAGGRGISKTRLSLGRTTLLTPNEARRVARDKLADARRGVDPAAERSAERDMPTLAKLADLHLAEVLAKRRAGTYALYRHYADRFVKPQLGSRKASAVTRADLAKLHRHIGEDRPVTANRVIAFISGIYAFAAKAGLVPEGLNSARGIEKFQEEGRERFLSAEEFQQLGIALREAETSGLEWAPDPAKPTSKHAPKAENRRVVFGTHVTGAIRLLLFTGCRLREILHLRWSDIDFERGMLFLPKSKTGKKSVVLSAPAFQVLTNLPRAGSYVIPGASSNTPRADLKKPWTAITKRAGLAGLRIHDLRHSFASVGAGGGLGLPIIGKLLGHSQASTTARYAHLDADPLRRASERIGATIASAMGETPIGKREGTVPCP